MDTGKLRNEAIDNLNNCLEMDLPKLSDAIKGEANEREELDQNIMKKVTDLFSRNLSRIC